MDRLSCGRGRTKRSGESASKSGRGKRQLSTGGWGEWKGELFPGEFVRKQTIRLKTVYFYHRLQARFNCNRVLTSVSKLHAHLLLNSRWSYEFPQPNSCIKPTFSENVSPTSFDVSGQKDSKNQKISFTFGLYVKIILAAFCQFVKCPLRTVFSFQIEAIRRGLLKVLSQAVLDLLTWQELERRVCGDPELTVEALKKCSKYNNN